MNQPHLIAITAIVLKDADGNENIILYSLDTKGEAYILDREVSPYVWRPMECKIYGLDKGK